MPFIFIAAVEAAQDTRPRQVSEPKQVGDVTSSGMSGGVTAGMIGSLQQTYTIPTLVRGPLLDEFKVRFTEGARLYRIMQDGSLSDEQYKQLFRETDAWINSSYLWLNEKVSTWAAERFLFRTGNSMSWMLPGDHVAEVVNMRSNYLNAVYPMLQNFDQLMREPSIYSDVPK